MTAHVDRRERWAATVAVAAVALVVLGWGVYAAIDGWYPIGDNGLLVLRARDVATEHHPWLGTWTSASLTVGTPLNNPGPLLFDVLAPFARIDPAGGVALGVAALNAACIVLAGVFARRAGGHRLAATTGVAAGALVFAMGSELLFDPWQPHSMLVPFLALIVLAVAIGAGDAVAIPWAVGIASLLVQTHLSYAVLAPGILAVGLGLGALRLRRRSRTLTEVGARRAWRRSLLVSVGVGLVLWAQPLWDQVARKGNLADVATNAGGGDQAVGLRAGLRLAGSVVGDPSGWLRSSFADTFRHDQAGVRIAPVGPPNAGIRELPTAAASLAAVVVLVVVSAVVARRRGRADGTSVAVVVGAALVLAVGTSTSLPASEVLGVAAHQLRWLWPVAIAAAVLPWASILPRGAPVTIAIAVVAVGAAVASLAPTNAGAGPSADVASAPAIRDMAAGLDAIPDGEVVYLDGQTLPFAEPFSGPLLLELQRRGIEFEVDEGALQHQVGTDRRGPDEATSQIRLVFGGPDVAQVPRGAQLLVEVDGLAPDERARHAELLPGVRDALADGAVRLNERGARARDGGALPDLVDPDWASDAALLLEGGLLARLVDEAWVDEGSLPAGAREWAQLDQRSRRYSVLVALEPLG